MADAKYGRLFTEQDVKTIVRSAIEHDVTSDDDLLDLISGLSGDGDLKFPEDEPLFVIRGKDQLAPSVVQNYLAAAAANGTQPDFQDLVAGSLNDIKAFQRDNADRVKLPD